MSTILAIETSSELASVALLYEGRILVREAVGVQMHSQTVLPMAQDLLVQAGIPLARCNAIAFGAGPGSFTGVRTACGVAQGLAFGLDLPIVPIVTLEAMAQGCRDAGDASDDVLVVLDARMEEVYWAQYHYENEWRVVIEPSLSLPSAVAPVGKVIACGNGLTAYSSVFDACSAIQGMQSDVMPHASQIAQLAQSALAAGRTVQARDAQPIYLRNKVALTTAERMSKVAT